MDIVDQSFLFNSVFGPRDTPFSSISSFTDWTMSLLGSGVPYSPWGTPFSSFTAWPFSFPLLVLLFSSTLEAEPWSKHVTKRKRCANGDRNQGAGGTGRCSYSKLWLQPPATQTDTKPDIINWQGKRNTTQRKRVRVRERPTSHRWSWHKRTECKDCFPLGLQRQCGRTL